MPFTNNNGMRIYYEVIGNGPPVILQHGLSLNLESWKWSGYVEPLAEKYQLILVDARGHGKSEKPHSPEKYAMKYMVGDIVTILDDLGIDKVTFWGYSMGGRIGLATGKYAPDRFSSLIIGGNGLSEKDSEPEIEELQGAIETYRRRELVKDYLEKGGSDDIEERKRKIWSNTDFEALIAYCSYYENIGMAEYLPKLTIPCLLYAGEKDTYPHSRAQACARIMQNAEFISIPGLNHGEAFFDSSTILPFVMRFLDTIQ